jgi:AcrR family transcriptional regulator
VKRQAAVEQTRARILEAARALITTDVSAFSVDAVAETAGVARMTVYYQFGSRVGLLEALFDDLGGRYFQAELPAALSREEPLDALLALIDVFIRFWASQRVVIRRVRGMAALDPDFEESLRGRDDRRRMMLRTLVGRLAARTGKPYAEALDETADVLYALTKFETFDTLATDRRSAEAVSLLIQRLVRLVLGLDETPSERG